MENKKISFLKKMKIGTRLFLLLGFLIVIPILLGALGFYGITTTDSAMRDNYHNRLIPITKLAKMEESLQEVMSQIYLGQKHDPNVPESVLHEETHTVQRHLDGIGEAWQDAQKFWGEYKQSKLSAAEKPFVDRVEKELSNFNSDARLPIVRGMKQKKFASIYNLAAYKLGGIFGKLQKEFQGLMNVTTGLAREKMKAAEEENVLIEGIMVGSILAGIIISLVLGLIVLRSVTGPLNEMVARVRDIAQGEGDLTKRLEISSRDELADLAGELNTFIEKIHDIVVDITGTTRGVQGASGRLNDSSQSLSASTEQTSHQSENISGAATELTQNMEIVSSSVEEMSVSVSEVAQKSAEAAKIANDAEKAANESNETVNVLGREAKDIGGIIDSIVSIAEQTNLLALNASIEAASAGDAGKGFAVVASEVKELARQAGDASEDIKTRVGGMQTQTEKTVRSIQEILGIIRKVSEISTTIASAVEEQSITSREIANNISQATTATNEVTKNISGISEASQQGAREAANTLDLARELKDNADKLKQIVDQFQVRESGDRSSQSGTVAGSPSTPREAQGNRATGNTTENDTETEQAGETEATTG